VAPARASIPYRHLAPAARPPASQSIAEYPADATLSATADAQPSAHGHAVPTTPAPEPPSIQSFSVAPTSMNRPVCHRFVEHRRGTTRVQLLRDGAAIYDNAPLNSSVKDCPPNTAPATIKYTLVAYNNANTGCTDVQVQVAPAPRRIAGDTTWQLRRRK